MAITHQVLQCVLVEHGVERLDRFTEHAAQLAYRCNDACVALAIKAFGGNRWPLGDAYNLADLDGIRRFRER